jgi:hypothetical protein
MSAKGKRTILNDVGEKETLWHTEFTFQDLWVIGPAVVIGLFCLIILSGTSLVLAWLVTGSLIGGSILLVWYVPPHRTAHGWIADVVSYADATKEQALYDPETPKTPKSLTRVSRFLSGDERPSGAAGAVLCSNNALVGAVQITSRDLALAPQSKWDEVADEFGAAINSLEFAFQIYATSRPVDVEALVAPYRQRKHEPAVQANPRLKQIIEVYETSFERAFNNRGVSVHEYYVFTSVTPLEVQLESQSGVQKFSRLPGGEILRSIGGARSDLSEAEIQHRQWELLTERLATLESTLGGVSMCSADRVEPPTLRDLIEEFWTGRSTGNPESVDDLPQIPIVTPDYTEEVTLE